MRPQAASCASRNVADDGSLTLKLRMPDCLAQEYGKYLVHRERALRLRTRAGPGCPAVQCRLQERIADCTVRRLHAAAVLDRRYKLPVQARSARGWRVFATTKMVKASVVTDRGLGAIGVDLNADHLAVTETDRSGNFVNTFSVPLVTYGKSCSSGRGARLEMQWRVWWSTPVRQGSPSCLS